MVNIFNEHRAFLEKLTSKEWLEARDKDKKAKMDGIKTDYLEDYKSDGLGKRAAEEKFQRLVASDKIPECQMLEFDENMYFTHP